MTQNVFEQTSRFVMIGTLMAIVGLMFLFYMGRSLVGVTRQYTVSYECVYELGH